MNKEETPEIHQYLTFKLDDEVFALTIAKVREVLDFTEITRVPKTPDYMGGVINVRGGVVPVIDLRVKFGMAPTPRTVNTCIIIVEVVMDHDTTVLGVLADQVEEVLEIDPQSIEAAPKIGTRLRNEFIQGMGKRDEQFIIILDIDKVFSGEELSVVQGADEAQAEA